MKQMKWMKEHGIKLVNTRWVLLLWLCGETSGPMIVAVIFFFFKDCDVVQVIGSEKCYVSFGFSFFFAGVASTKLVYENRRIATS